MERDLELERRKANSLQESLKENEKEYHKLKVVIFSLFELGAKADRTFRLNTISSSARRFWAETSEEVRKDPSHLAIRA